MNKEILLIEDDENIANILQELLGHEGYQVKHALNGKIALDYLHSVSALPALIFLDLMMPVMDGFQFRAIQTQDSKIANIPVVIITANGNIEEIKDKIKAYEYLQKPFDFDMLLKLIKSIC